MHAPKTRSVHRGKRALRRAVHLRCRLERSGTRSQVLLRVCCVTSVTEDACLLPVLLPRGGVSSAGAASSVTCILTLSLPFPLFYNHLVHLLPPPQTFSTRSTLTFSEEPHPFQPLLRTSTTQAQLLPCHLPSHPLPPPLPTVVPSPQELLSPHHQHHPFLSIHHRHNNILPSTQEHNLCSTKASRPSSLRSSRPWTSTTTSCSIRRYRPGYRVLLLLGLPKRMNGNERGWGREYMSSS